MTPIKLPKILTYKEWSLQKNIISVLGSGNTGIGKSLKALEAEFQKVNWAGLEPAGANTPGTFDAKRASQQANFQKAAAVSTALKNLVDTATKAETKLKSSKAVPDASKKHVTKLKDAAKKLQQAVDGLDDAWDNERKNVVAMMDRTRQILSPQAAELVKLGAAAKQGDTAAADQFFDQYKLALRMIRGSVGMMPGSIAA
jgi:hypothetical protein